MSISRVGAGAASGTSVTIPVGHQNGDLMIIFSFNDGGTQPALVAGWTSIGNGTPNLVGIRVAWKRASSSSEVSGTWTNATQTSAVVYRGTATNKAPAVNSPISNGSGTTVTYQNLTTKSTVNSWVLAVIGHASIDTTLETAPTGLTNIANIVDATCESAVHDSNGVMSAFTSRTVAVGGTSGGWASFMVEILAETGVNNNYQFVSVADNGNAVMSVTEKIR